MKLLNFLQVSRTCRGKDAITFGKAAKAPSRMLRMP